MTVEFKFDITQRVIASEIGRPGVVHAVRRSIYGNEVLVVYWNDGSRAETWVYEWELEARA